MTIRDRSGYQELIDRYRKARSDSSLAVLEGFHSLKHALRFGATIVETVSCDSGQLNSLTESLAPDLIGVLGEEAIHVPESIFKQLSPAPPSTGVISLARRPALDLARLENPSPLVLLENPRSYGNVGAVVRVAAAAGASAVITTGEHDPWRPSALVGSAGLHFALPVARIASPALNEWPEYLAGRQLIALDPCGSPLEPGSIPEMSILAFGTERDGLSSGLLNAAHRRMAIPMEPGVSSLNLATAVAVALYSWRLG